MTRKMSCRWDIPTEPGAAAGLAGIDRGSLHVGRARTGTQYTVPSRNTGKKQRHVVLHLLHAVDDLVRTPTGRTVARLAEDGAVVGMTLVDTAVVSNNDSLSRPSWMQCLHDEAEPDCDHLDSANLGSDLSPHSATPGRAQRLLT